MWRMTATEIRDAVRAGEVSALGVVRSCLGRIAELNPAINAVSVVLQEQAEDAAIRIDAARARGDKLGSLAGVPVTVKEAIHVAGVATTFGIPRLRHLLPAVDAPPVRNLRAAGAIPIAHTNLSDLSIGGTNTRSQLYGTTLNPWDVTRSPGGSSGGDGAAVAVGMAPLGLGNDSGGSVRLPAMFCGITALKPTYGRFPADHRVGDDDEPTLASQLFPVDGPFARTVADLATAFEALAGDEPIDPRTSPVPLQGEPLSAPVRVGVVADPGGRGVDPSVVDAITRAADALRDAGYDVEEVEVPRLEDSLNGYHTLINTEFGLAWPRIRPLLTDESATHLERSMSEHPPADLAGYIAATALRHSVVRDWKQFQVRYPLMLGPVNTQPAGPADSSDPAPPTLEHPLRLCSATTFAGVPALAVPTGIHRGMPTGVQVIGRHYREDLCLAAAQAIESAVGVLAPTDPQLAH